MNQPSSRRIYFEVVQFLKINRSLYSTTFLAKFCPNRKMADYFYEDCALHPNWSLPNIKMQELGEGWKSHAQGPQKTVKEREGEGHATSGIRAYDTPILLVQACLLSLLLGPQDQGLQSWWWRGQPFILISDRSRNSVDCEPVFLCVLCSLQQATIGGFNVPNMHFIIP